MSGEGPTWGERPESGPTAPSADGATSGPQPPAPSRPQYPAYPGEPGGVAPSAPEPWGPATAAAPAATTGPPRAQPVAGPGVEPAGWWIRVAAAVVDWLVPTVLTVVPFVAGLVVAFSGSRYDEATDTVTDVQPGGLVITGLSMVAFVAFDVWNRGLRVGYRGESLGKQLVGVRVVRRDGTVTGALEGFFRWLVGLFLQWTFVGLLLDLLWPLGNDDRQTLHDKAIGTFPVRT